jgi:PKD repeat protein
VRNGLGVFVLLLACKSSATSDPDGGVNVRLPDAAPRSDAVDNIPLAVDFTVSACPHFEAVGPRCSGAAPLTLEFVPLFTPSVSKFLWDFGDGTAKSSARTPSHTYAFPGTYDVSLVGGGQAGSAPRTHAGFVVVTANHAGDPCDVDQQCDGNLRCICGSTAKCTAAFTRGLCASSCATTACGATEICADLPRAVPPDVPEAWQQPTCLLACATDLDCGGGLGCRDLPALSPAGTWVRGCFPGAPAAPGSACRNASGQLRPDACITGQCADLGANGVCSVDCTTAPCPPGASCAELTDGRHLCLQRCTPEVPCDRDPLLACTSPGTGPLGFSLPAGTTGTFCAPKLCANDEDCGSAGLCHDDATGAQCARRPSM